MLEIFGKVRQSNRTGTMGSNIFRKNIKRNHTKIVDGTRTIIQGNFEVYGLGIISFLFSIEFNRIEGFGSISKFVSFPLKVCSTNDLSMARMSTTLQHYLFNIERFQEYFFSLNIGIHTGSKCEAFNSVPVIFLYLRRLTSDKHHLFKQTVTVFLWFRNRFKTENKRNRNHFFVNTCWFGHENLF